MQRDGFEIFWLKWKMGSFLQDQSHCYASDDPYANISILVVYFITKIMDVYLTVKSFTQYKEDCQIL